MTHSSGLGRVLPFAALMLSAMLSACASHGNQDELQAHNQQLQTKPEQTSNFKRRISSFKRRTSNFKRRSPVYRVRLAS